MAFKLTGKSNTQNEIEANTRATRVVPAPLDIGTTGTYITDTVTGTMAAGIGAASEVFQFRWTHATWSAFVRRVRISARSLGTGFTAGVAVFDILIARAFTAAGTGGGTLTLTGVNDLRTDFPNPIVNEIRQATTAALGAGTKTLDTYALSSLTSVVPTTTDFQFQPTADLYLPDFAAGEHPVILEANEGLIIRATVPATGTWSMRVGIIWDELLEY